VTLNPETLPPLHGFLFAGLLFCDLDDLVKSAFLSVSLSRPPGVQP
jgi:hypothetical protein